LDKERCEVYYSGRVQGVGFRYTVRQVAAGYDVDGFVRNLPDGTVQLVAEGVPEEIDRLLGSVKRVLGDYIRGTRENRGLATGEFRGFQIRF